MARASSRLDLIPVVNERYFLICTSEFLDAPATRRIRDVLGSKQFRAEAGSLAGIDVTQAGAVLGIDEVFPELQEMENVPQARNQLT